VGERGAHGTTLTWPCLARQPIPHSGSGVYPLSIERSACETRHLAVQLRCLSLRVPGGHADRPWLVDARRPGAGGVVARHDVACVVRLVEPMVCPLLAGSIRENHAISRRIEATGKQPPRQRWIAVAGVAANIATPGEHQYLDWTASLPNATGLLSLPAPTSRCHWGSPSSPSPSPRSAI
jgi:hypothetical protein